MTEFKTLFVLSSAPYGNTKAMEILDAVLTAAAFEFKVTVLVLGCGVWQLLKEQHAAAISQKQFTDVLSGLSWYDIEELWVAEDALTSNGLTSGDLMTTCKLATSEQMQQLMTESHCIIHG